MAPVAGKGDRTLWDKVPNVLDVYGEPVTDSLGNILKTIHISAANLNQFVNEPQNP